VAALDLLQELDEIEDMDQDPPAASDQVFIRAGQAGTAGPASGRSGKARPEPEERQGRSGRLKLRRRSQDSP
jgi:hypothetical protein